jgi:hypothetical protein
MFAPGYILGKFGSALTSLICWVCRSRCARDEQHPLVGIQLPSHQTVGGVGPQVVMAGQEIPCLLAGFLEMLQRSLRRAVAVRRHQRFRRLCLPAAVRNGIHHQLIDRSYVLPPPDEAARSSPFLSPCRATDLRRPQYVPRPGATDQRSGPGLKFHCASESPAVESSAPCSVLSRYFNAFRGRRRSTSAPAADL